MKTTSIPTATDPAISGKCLRGPAEMDCVAPAVCLRFVSEDGGAAGLASGSAGADFLPLVALAGEGDALVLTAGGIGPASAGVALGFAATGGGVEERLTGGPPTNRGFAAAGGAVIAALAADE